MKPKALLAYCREKGIKSVDLRFADLHGDWRHLTFPLSALTESSFEEGFGQLIALLPIASTQTAAKLKDYLILVPQSEANYLDPFPSQPALVLIASIQDTIMREESPFDSRQVALRAMRFLEASTIGDGLAVRSSVPFRSVPATGCDSPAYDRFLACGMDDADFIVRSDIADIASDSGLQIDRHYCDVGGSSTMILKASNLIECCDDIMMLRYLIGQFSKSRGFKIAFDNLWMTSQWTISRQGESIFAGSAFRGMSDFGMYALGGILKHADAITAISKFSDLESGPFPWLNLCSSDHPDSLCHVAVASHNPRSRAIEFSGTPSRSNPYLVYSAILMAMIDGIQNKTPVGRTLDVPNNASFNRKDFAIANSDSSTLDLKRLKTRIDEDRDFLLQNEVFSDTLIDVIRDQLPV